MDIKLKNYSHSIITKMIAFVLVILCFTGAITSFINVIASHNSDFGIVFEESYFLSRSYIEESEELVRSLRVLISEYKNEERILNEETVTEEEMRSEEENLFSDFQFNSRSYNPNASEEENYVRFKELYADKISQRRAQMINHELQTYHQLLQRLEEVEGILYYASDGVNVFTNSPQTEKESFKAFSSYMLFDKQETVVYPLEIKNNEYYRWIRPRTDEFDQKDNVIYIAFTEAFLNQREKEWNQNKGMIQDALYRILGFSLGLMLSFIYLLLIVGRKAFKDEELHINAIDRVYNDINLLLCLGLITLWIGSLQAVVRNLSNFNKIIIPITAFIAVFGLVLVLSLVKHFKNKTILKHTLIYRIFYKLFKFVKGVYDSGSAGVKMVLIVIGYPIIVAATFFIFPVTIGAAAWLTLKRIKEFNAIKEGVEKIKDGDIHHTIAVNGNGEFGKLAANINSITDGLKKAVDNELKSERLKAELITNVSHDTRTPLTSIITYIDLLKKEKDPLKTEEYLEILDQKSQRLKALTDDLFEAAKASSGNIPVNLERIDIVSLITQGLGELNDKIEDLALEFKINQPIDKLYITADGRLLWRAIENLLSNIFKYALKGSRVYVDIEDLGNEIVMVFKNISAYELNISADELMERFKRGDESRSSQGSGLGLSIAKSLIDIQRGRFHIEIDGDLFKAVIYMPKKNNQ
ncbi:HAMP domain-containing sensor histidine kinase [Geosporobacter ferrireducens]|uniref:histidine kinase n=1 Tax=Geosporobacter ferrireducens TaxID=1424294 RepID=A0A1D8GEY5_9FIRM|nr:HAMP domain-containing sensor histidine kinase [Geosporobacter ferrireducens]AOT69467.1 two-component sensor histidine kinase [Geosporobacter ferrireducens]